METGQIENNPLLLNPVVSRLILAVNNMAKKPKIDDDLSGVLDTFIEKLNESEKYLSNGICNTNFAEAALLLQSSVEMYGKKIDLLWDSIIQYQKHIITYEKDSAIRAKEVELVNDRQNRFKRKRKIQQTGLRKEQTSISELLMNSAKEIENVQPCETLQNNWDACINKQDIDKRPRNNAVKSRCLYIIDTAVYDDEELLLNTGSLSINKIAYELKKDFCAFRRLCLRKECGYVTHFYEHDTALQKYLKEKKVSVDEVEKLHRDLYKTFFVDYLREKEFAARNVSARLAEKCAALCPKNVVARVQRLSQDVLLQYLKKDLSQERIKRANSTVPSVCEHEKELFSDSEDTSVADSAFGDDVDLSVAKSISIDASKIANDRVLEETIVAKESSKPAKLAEINVENRTIIKELSKKVNCKEVLEEDSPKRKHRKSSMRVKPIIKVTVPMKQFEKFFSQHYEPEDGEGKATEIYSESEDENEDTSYTQLNDVRHDFADDSAIDIQFKVHEKNSTLPSLSAVTKQNISAPDDTVQRIKENQDSQKRIEEWKTFISNKLEHMEQHSDFDIHAYGTKIIESLEVKDSKKFKDIVQGKNAGEVSRYFLATLQLANTYNVEIIQHSDGTIANDTLQLKLLSKERYHESLEDYMAPSEETFQERLARAQALNPRVPLFSTPNKPKVQSQRVKKISNKDNPRSYADPSTSGIQVHHRSGGLTSR